jgi:hypothetical protein
MRTKKEEEREQWSGNEWATGSLSGSVQVLWLRTEGVAHAGSEDRTSSASVLRWPLAWEEDIESHTIPPQRQMLDF